MFEGRVESSKRKTYFTTMLKGTIRYYESDGRYGKTVLQ